MLHYFHFSPFLRLIMTIVEIIKNIGAFRVVQKTNAKGVLVIIAS
mgnify:CR=1 FL=1